MAILETETVLSPLAQKGSVEPNESTPEAERLSALQAMRASRLAVLCASPPFARASDQAIATPATPTAVQSKVSHTLNNDLREYAVEFLGLSRPEYRGLMGKLWRVQEKVYDIDYLGESRRMPSPVQLSSLWTRLGRCLRAEGWWTRRSALLIGRLITYQGIEACMHLRSAVPEHLVAQAPHLKSADIQLLRMITETESQASVSPTAKAFFEEVDATREIFDDIRDFDEDAHTLNFNLLHYRRHTHSWRLTRRIIDDTITIHLSRVIAALRVLSGVEAQRGQYIAERLTEEAHQWSKALAEL